MKADTSHQNRDAASSWEDEGGARLDVSHESDARGEHRYPDAHQTTAEQRARQERDDLKRGLSRRRNPRPGRTR